MKTNVDMSNISIVDGELIDYEYEQQKINAEETKKLKKFWFRLIIWLTFILPLATAVIRLFIEVASFTRKYS
ncbi:MAG: hypothetical protein K2N27_07755 [Ruminococcus sp.]|nr:hypothetical protein [Ruminococcus sp.]